MKTNFKDMQHQRVYITNFINRRFTGIRACTICGNTENLSVVHNKVDPYKISFICKNCKNKLDRTQLESLPKINILEHIEINKKFSHSKDLILDDKMKLIIENALVTDKSLVNYLRENDISYYKYKVAVEKYENKVKPIKIALKRHFKELRANSIMKSKNSK